MDVQPVSVAEGGFEGRTSTFKRTCFCLGVLRIPPQEKLKIRKENWKIEAYILSNSTRRIAFSYDCRCGIQ